MKKTIEKSKRRNIIVIAVLFIIILAILMVASRAYAKYISTASGKATASIGELICEMTVTPSAKENTIINPYCDVVVKNYNSDNKVTQTTATFTIKAEPDGEFEMPDYYWLDSENTIVAQSTDLVGTIDNITSAVDQNYRIVFQNDGEQEIHRNVKLTINAVQSK